MEGDGTIHVEGSPACFDLHPDFHADAHAESHLDLQPAPVRDADRHFNGMSSVKAVL